MADELPGADPGLLDRTVDRVRVGAQHGLDVRLAPDQSAALAAELDRLTAELRHERAKVESLTEVRGQLQGYRAELRDERDRLAGQVQEALALHTPVRSSAVDKQVCRNDRFNWPCETVRALTGATTPDADPHGQQVRCDRCWREYVPSPTDDYYCTPVGDHCCEPCLLRGAGFTSDDVRTLPEPLSGESMGEYGVRLGLRPGVGGRPIEAIGDGDDTDPRLT